MPERQYFSAFFAGTLRQAGMGSTGAEKACSRAFVCYFMVVCAS